MQVIVRVFCWGNFLIGSPHYYIIYERPRFRAAYPRRGIVALLARIGAYRSQEHPAPPKRHATQRHATEQHATEQHVTEKVCHREGMRHRKACHRKACHPKACHSKACHPRLSNLSGKDFVLFLRMI